MAEETNPANPDETKTQGEAGEKQPAAKEGAPKAKQANEAAPKTEAAPKRPGGKEDGKAKERTASACSRSVRKSFPLNRRG
jgi:hypothetical protein